MRSKLLLKADALSYAPSGSHRSDLEHAPQRLLVDTVNLSIREGEIVGVTGPNGAGKSTLLRLLSGFIQPTSGTVYYGDRMLGSLKHRERAAWVSYMTQKGPDTFPFSVIEIVEMGSYARRTQKNPVSSKFSGDDGESAFHNGAGGVDSHPTAMQALEEVGLAHLADRSFSTLSGGEQQLVIFAQVLLQQTPLLLLDEPTASLDLGHEAQLMHKIRELSRRKHSALLALHNLNSAAEYCDRIILMSHGRIVSEGRPRDVFTEENIRTYYETEVRTGVNEATGSLIVTALPKPAAPAGLRVHLIGGAGSAVSVTRRLFLLGVELTGGVAHELDSDAKLWNSLGIDCVTVPAFADIEEDEDAYCRAAAMVEEADLTILCRFPVGHGNLANLHLARKADELLVIGTGGEKEWCQGRDFFTDNARMLFADLQSQARMVSLTELLDVLRERIENLNERG